MNPFLLIQFKVMLLLLLWHWSFTRDLSAETNSSNSFIFRYLVSDQITNGYSFEYLEAFDKLYYQRLFDRKRNVTLDNHISYKQLHQSSHNLWGFHDRVTDKIRDKSDRRSVNEATYLSLGILSEIFHHRLSLWFASSPESTGYYIKSADILEERLTAARKRFGFDCRRNDTLLFKCLITKYDATDLQEWVVWQLFVVGAHHLLIYLNDFTVDNSEEVLQPFVDAGYVTVFKNFVGPSQQNYVYSDCIKHIRLKSCHFNPYPQLSRTNLSNYLHDTQNCGKNDDFDIYHGQDRTVWVSGLDSDEFTLTNNRSCFIDHLKKYSNHRGLVLPWYNFGHSNILLSPRHVVSAYKYRTYRTKIGKTYNRVYFVSDMFNSHQAIFQNNKKLFGVNETFHVTDWHMGPFVLEHQPIFSNLATAKAGSKESNDLDAIYTNSLSIHYPIIHPTLKIHHYLTKSAQHLLKKWLRGVADDRDHWGRQKLRPLSDVAVWFHAFASRLAYSNHVVQLAYSIPCKLVNSERTVYDDRAAPYGDMVEWILHGTSQSSQSMSHRSPILLSVSENRSFRGKGYNMSDENVNATMLNMRIIQGRTDFYFRDDKLSYIILGLMKEYLYRRRSDLIASSSGYYLTTSTEVDKAVRIGRLWWSELSKNQSQYLFRNSKVTVSRVIYTVTSYEEAYLQEWLLWHLIQADIDHIVIYLTQAVHDNSYEIIRPFLLSGYVSVIDVLEEPSLMIDLSTIYPERSRNISDQSSQNDSQTNSHILQYLSVHKTRLRLGNTIWLGYMSVSEFMIIEKSSFEKSNTLWGDSTLSTVVYSRIEFGHSNYLLIPNNELVTETYLHAAINYSDYVSYNPDGSYLYWKKYEWSLTQDNAVESLKDASNKILGYTPSVGNLYHEKIQNIRVHVYYTKSVEYFTKRWILAHSEEESYSNVDDVHDDDLNTFIFYMSLSKAYKISALQYVNKIKFYSSRNVIYDDSARYGVPFLKKLLFKPS